MATALFPMQHRLLLYLRLVRLDKPIGILLLLWPTLWGLWVAGDGAPPWRVVAIFVLGTALMRSAGCAINDYFDRDFDLHVARTRDRVLTSGRIAPWEALVVAAALALVSFLLVLPLNALTIQLAFVGAFLAATYPLFKRFFAIPQAYLGIAFGFGIPMSFAALQNAVPPVAWVMLAANIAWAVAYDTEYAMVDRDDDLRIGVKSTAILFGEADRLIIGILQVLMLVCLLLIGQRAELGAVYYVTVGVAAAMFGYQQYLIRDRSREGCFRAFLNNNYVGGVVFAGVLLHYAYR